MFTLFVENGGCCSDTIIAGRRRERSGMNQPIRDYHLDSEGHWVAELACGHFQHVRHNPPMESRDWVLTDHGRASMIGFRLECKKCDQGMPADGDETVGVDS